MIVLGVLQCNCELIAEPIDRPEQTKQKISGGVRAGRGPGMRERERGYAFQRV